MSKEVVKNSLLRSSINIKNISRSVSSFSTGFIKAQGIATSIQKQTEEDSQYKSTLIRSDDSYFRKRQENIKRKDREDEIEASTVGGAIRRTGSVASKSTRGFLGRILDTIGVLFVGWMLTTLPALNKSIVGFIGRVSTLMRALNGMVDSIINNLTFFESNLKNSDEAIQQIDFTEDERYMKEELDSTDDSFRKLTRDLFSTFETFNDPRSMGIPRNSWDEVASTPLNEIVPPQLLPEESEQSEVVDTKKGETEGTTPPLPKTDKVKGDPGERTPPSTTRDEVKGKVQRILAKNFNASLAGDGFMLEFGSTVILVNVLEEPFGSAGDEVWLVGIHGRVLQNVELTNELALKIATEAPLFGSISWNNGNINIGHVLIGNTLDEEELALSLAMIGHYVDQIDDEWQLRFGGQKIIE